METARDTLLFELKKLWDEIGEPDNEKDKMLFELEQECLEVYRGKVNQAKKGKAQLRQAIADAEAELADICSALGERPLHATQSFNGCFKEEFTSVIAQLEEMRKRKIERRDKFVEVTNQILNISFDICGAVDDNMCNTVLDESDLSLKRLEELRRKLIELQNEKSNRLNQVMDHLSTLKSLCVVLGTDFNHTISEIHPSLDDSKGMKNLSTETIHRLDSAIKRLREVKMQRMDRLLDLATAMLELWNLMDTPTEEQQKFQNVTRNIAASEHEITEPDTLSLDSIKYAEAEVSRLQQLKSSKMKELFLKKKLELDDICRKTHMVLNAHSAREDSLEAIDSGVSDPACLLEEMELLIAKVKEEAISRKEILEKVEKWLAACEEECWLEEYNRDDNRYNAGRGTHLTLKRAEKARVLVNKIPAMVEALTLNATAWEKERGVEFGYDGVQLLSMLEQYSILRQEKEQERQRQRDHKKLQGQLLVEQEALFGSKPSPSKSGKKVPRYSIGGAANRRLSLGGVMLQTTKPEKAALLHSHSLKKSDCINKNTLNRQNLSGFTGRSTGNRKLSTAGNLVKKHSATANEHGNESHSPLARKPFAPITSSISSKVNVTSFREDEKRKHKETSQKLVPSCKAPMSTPPKSIFVDEENKTPKAMSIPTPATPLSVSVPMHTAITPATPCGKEVGIETEYSFEERRAYFFLPKSNSKALLQVPGEDFDWFFAIPQYYVENKVVEGYHENYDDDHDEEGGDQFHGYDGYDEDNDDEGGDDDDFFFSEDEGDSCSYNCYDLERRCEEFIAMVIKNWREELYTETKLLCMATDES